MKIYVASSWRNRYQQDVVAALRTAGHEVYDFRNPAPGDNGFHWSAIDPDWQTWTPEQFRSALSHPIADHGFNNDMNALRECDACVLVLPSGRSAHLEAGWAAGAGKLVAIFIPEPVEPELMYYLADFITVSHDELLSLLQARVPA